MKNIAKLQTQTRELLNPLNLIVDPLGKLKAVMRGWVVVYDDLKAIDPTTLNKPLRGARARLLKSGAAIVNRMRTMGIAADTASGDSLGFVPVIAAGVIAASAGLVLYWLSDYKKFSEKLNEYNSLRESGLSPDQAASVIKKLDGGGGFTDGVVRVAKVGGAIGGMWIAWKFLKKRGLI